MVNPLGPFDRGKSKIACLEMTVPPDSIFFNTIADVVM